MKNDYLEEAFDEYYKRSYINFTDALVLGNNKR